MPNIAASFYLDFLIALVFIIALCSIVLSMVYEAISYYLKTRGNFLKNALEEVLNDTVHIDKLNLTELLYAHPQIDLTKKTYRHLPAYMSSLNFAQTLVDTLCQKYRRDHTTITSNPTEKAVVTAPVEISKIDTFTKAVNELGYCDLQILLKGFISGAENSLDKLYANLVQWYEEYMNRVSGWYKIRTQKRLFVLGIAVCIAINADFINISKSLLNDKALTQQIAQAAENYHIPALNGTDTGAARVAKAIQIKNEVLDSLYHMNAPIFWEREPVPVKEWKADYWVWKTLGWLIMAGLLSFGGPFWFELLNKLVNIRKTGAKPAGVTPSLPVASPSIPLGNVVNNS